jgi:hypothetical protein
MWKCFPVVVSWKQWEKDFMRGKLLLAYLLIANIILTVIGFVMYGNLIVYRYVFLVDVVAGVGVLVDTTAHLFLGKISEGLSAVNQAYLIREFFRGRTHVDYAVVAGIVATAVGIGLNGGGIPLVVLLGIVVGVFILEFGILLKTRYYH